MPDFPLVVPSSFRIIAHRGASGYAPENTMAAFSLAARMGIREVELDVQFSQDRRLVVCHDRVLDRYGHPGGRVAEMTLAELKTLDIGSWFSPRFADERILTLEELLSHFGSRFIYHVEIKEEADGIEAAVLKAIDEHGLGDRVIVTSFHSDALRTIKDLDPSIPVGWLVKEGGLSEPHIERAVEIGCLQICPLARDLTPDGVQTAHTVLAEVRAHGVRSAVDALNVVNSGADGATVDRPDWFAHGNGEKWRA